MGTQKTKKFYTVDVYFSTSSSISWSRVQSIYWLANGVKFVTDMGETVTIMAPMQLIVVKEKKENIS